MNRTEQKERISEIIDITQNVIDSYKSFEEECVNIVNKYDELYCHLADEGYADILDTDLDEFSNQIALAILSDQTEIEYLKSQLYDFQSELEEYMDELSESRREKLEERYVDLEDVIDSLEFENSDFTYFDILEQLEEKLETIKGMK